MGNKHRSKPMESFRASLVSNACKNKAENDIQSAARQYRRGDIYYIRKDAIADNVGSEMRTPGRPCIIVSNNTINHYAPTVVVVFLTSKDKINIPEHTKISLKGKFKSTVLCEQPTAIDKSRLGSYIRSCTSDEMARVDKALKSCLTIYPIQESTDQVATDREEEPSTNALSPSVADGLSAAEPPLVAKESLSENTSEFVKELKEQLLRVTVERDLLYSLYQNITASVVGGKSENTK